VAAIDRFERVFGHAEVERARETRAKELIYNSLLQRVSDMLSQLDLSYFTKRFRLQPTLFFAH
jgi:hypothetical protein